MTVLGKMEELASGFRRRYKLDRLLSLDDMIMLITPPKGNILLEPDGFKFTRNYDKNNLTDADGATIQSNCYIVPGYYSAEKTKLDNPATRPNLTLRLNFNVVSSTGEAVNWGIDGAGKTTTWYPNATKTSDYNLETGLLVDEHNALVFQTTGTTKIDLATSYLEIIMGGVIRSLLTTVTNKLRGCLA